MRTIIFDTEANGYKDEQICQLSYIMRENGEHVSKNYYFAVSSMNPYAQKVHGLSKAKLDELSSGKRFHHSYVEIFEDFRKADLLIGHNVASDISRLRLEFFRCDAILRPPKTLCTMKFFNNALKLSNKDGQKKYPKLSELCEYYHIDPRAVKYTCGVFFGDNNVDEHDARYDTTATYLAVISAMQVGDLRGVI